jgi:SAM-dependent methyltransferase
MADPNDWRAEWDRRYTDEKERWREPDLSLPTLYEEFLRPAFPNGGRALDVAGGMGRHAMWLAERGWDVTLWDFSAVALENMNQIAAERNVAVNAVKADVRSADFGNGVYDLIVVFYFLEREVLPKLVPALRPGGFLLYKTYTLEQLDFEKGPKDEAYLLKPNELLRSFPRLQVVHYKELVTDGGRAEILGRKV